MFRSPDYTKNRDGARVPNSSEIVIIDFGSATFEYDHHTAIVSTRHYRAPEVILGTGWNYECDVWSLGCIVLELFAGDALFQTHENLEHLALMEKILGPIPVELVRQANRGKKYFNDDKLLWPVNASSDESVDVVNDAVPLREQLADHSDLYDLICGCLNYSKADRLTASECLQHRFFAPLHHNKKFERLIPPAMRSSLARQRSGKVLLEASSMGDSASERGGGGSPML